MHTTTLLHHNTDHVALARDIAVRAHGTQTDKGGAPYIHHPARVAASLYLPDMQAVAWLHDVVEDTEVTLADLADAGIPDRVVEAVEAITHRHGEPRVEYYARVRANPLALAVKLADIADNQAPARLGALDPDTQARLTNKYQQALTHLIG